MSLELLSFNNETREMNGTHTSAIWKFEDFMRLKVSQQFNTSNSEVYIISNSIPGAQWDFGQNYKNVQGLLDKTKIDRSEATGFKQVILGGC
jgi:hypothetical protein